MINLIRQDAKPRLVMLQNGCVMRIEGGALEARRGPKKLRKRTKVAVTEENTIVCEEACPALS